MKIDDADILRYVQNEIPEERRAVFETLISSDPALANKVAAMRASELPYRAAVESVSTPELPDSVRQSFEQFAAVANNGELGLVPQKQGAAFAEQKFIAVAAVFSLLSFGLGLLASPFMSGSVPAHSESAMGDLAVVQSEQRPAGEAITSELIDAMIIYQSLYTRETVEPVRQSLEAANVLMGRFNQRNKTSFTIPDLSASGYEFRRAQVLSHRDNSILQLVYLGEQGEPIALCLTDSQGAAIDFTEAENYRFADMNTKLWQEQGVVFMLMTRLDDAALAKLFGLVG